MPRHDTHRHRLTDERPARGKTASALFAPLLALFALLLSAICLSCLDRPIGTGQPRTTNVLQDELVNNSVDKVDLLFVIDNSLSMADKQRLLAVAVPDLVQGLLEPSCIDQGGRNIGRPPSGECPMGSAPEFTPVDDIHVGVITSSLGGYGAERDCVDDGTPDAAQRVDMAHLLGKLPRGAEVAPSAAASGFLAWNRDTNQETFIAELTGLVTRAGERGCGWEAPLEAWVRFLVDPNPYTEIVRRPCHDGDTQQNCAGPRTDEQGRPLVDDALLAERRAFLRPDSLLAIIMLSDENDCSFRAGGQSWLLSRTWREVDGKQVFTPAPRATKACDDPAFGPNHQCCRACGGSTIPEGCPVATNEEGNTVAQGCEQGSYQTAQEDLVNLRCYRQKERFGVDMLYPVRRYSNALHMKLLCPYADDLDPNAPECANGGVVDNPLYADLQYTADDPMAVPKPARPESLVFLAGIVGVPWQDIAVSPDTDEPLTYRPSVPTAAEDATPGINWRWLLGDPPAEGGTGVPEDPLMIESVEPRTGVNPATAEPLAPLVSGYGANAINGHEWNPLGGGSIVPGDLQFACIFPLEQPEVCLTRAELDALSPEAAAQVRDCDCTDYGEEFFANPLCQQPDGSYGLTQTRAKAYPSIRQLQVLHDYGKNAIVASICPKSTDRSDVDYGYRPAMGAIVERLIGELTDKCYSRELTTRADGRVSCIIVEALPPGEDDRGCDVPARQPVSEDVSASVRRRLLAGNYCPDEASCAAYRLCEIEQLTAEHDPAGLASCRDDQVPQGDGWCYLDERLGLGNRELLETCPTTARRKVRYAGKGEPRHNSVTIVSCAGATFDDTD